MYKISSEHAYATWYMKRMSAGASHHFAQLPHKIIIKKKKKIRVTNAARVLTTSKCFVAPISTFCKHHGITPPCCWPGKGQRSYMSKLGQIHLLTCPPGRLLHSCTGRHLGHVKNSILSPQKWVLWDRIEFHFDKLIFVHKTQFCTYLETESSWKTILSTKLTFVYKSEFCVQNSLLWDRIEFLC